MGWRGTAVLALLVAAVAAYLWFEGAARDEQASRALTFGEPAAREPTEPVRHLLDFQPASVVSVRLEQAGIVREVRRDGGSWQGTTAAGAVGDFLNNLTGLGVLMEIPADAADLKDYGLQPARSIVEIHLRDRATPLVLQIGDHNPATTGVYVRIGGNGPVVLAGALAAWEFDKAFKALGEASPGG